MIARTWHGAVPAAKADAYHSYLLRTGLADYAAAPGNRGVLTLRQTEGGVAHFVLVTVWASLDAVRDYAGDDVLRARYYPEEDDFLLEKEPFVTHCDLPTGVASGTRSLSAPAHPLLTAPSLEVMGSEFMVQTAVQHLLVSAGIGACGDGGRVERPALPSLEIRTPDAEVHADLERDARALPESRPPRHETHPDAPPERLLVRERGRIVPVRLADVVRLEAQGDYALLHTRSGVQHLAYLSLGGFTARRDTGSFLRIHRSHVVNLDYVKAFVPHDAARLAAEMTDGTVIVASRTRSTFIRRHAH